MNCLPRDHNFQSSKTENLINNKYVATTDG